MGAKQSYVVTRVPAPEADPVVSEDLGAKLESKPAPGLDLKSELKHSPDLGPKSDLKHSPDLGQKVDPRQSPDLGPKSDLKHSPGLDRKPHPDSSRDPSPSLGPGSQTASTAPSSKPSSKPSSRPSSRHSSRPSSRSSSRSSSPAAGMSSADPGRRSPSSSPDRPGSRASHVSRASTSSAGTQRLCKSKSRSLSDGESCFGEDFAQECLRVHNEYRARHGVHPLKLSKKLSRYSEDWAKRLAARGVIEHRNESDYGENIFCSWSSNAAHTVAGDEPVHHWYNEIKDHKFGKEPTSLKTGHFTQVVWKDSRELGVAVARSRTGQVFVVANYSPPGNFVGCFAENVPPVGGFPPTPGAALSPVREGVEAGGTEDLAQEGLRLHNEYRRQHGVAALRLSPRLCEYARDWARTLAREDRFAHRPDGRYGENIFCAWSPDSGTGAPGSSSRVGAKEACDTWYKEIKEHPFGQEPRLLKSGHFSQMIWKESKELGMGFARSKNGRTIIVANYHPRGNYIGQFADNVPRPTSGPFAS
ncbi:uncharacterized protein LOC117653301 isoform X1 [Thrips palmi]|uniref:Uncharacterized protein LOC117653301 isoform X1 n=1 Tax=Thrips palmi TaxID=161013 RepID=A0A6P9A9Q8_THRPL|nr:uncharacterized protein LOC117653301 isoform X1 [Thrips palmi]